MNSQFKNSSLGFYLYAFLIVIIAAAVVFVVWFMIAGYKLGTYEEDTLLGSVYVGGMKEEEIEPIMLTRIDRWLGDETIVFEVKYQGYSYELDRELFNFDVVQSTRSIKNGITNPLVVFYGENTKDDIIRELKSFEHLQGVKENVNYDSLIDDILYDASLMKSYSVSNVENYLLDDTSYEVINSSTIYVPNSVNIDNLLESLNNVYEDGKLMIPAKYYYDIIDELGDYLDDSELSLLSKAMLELSLETNFSINEVHYENKINNYDVDDYPYFGFNSIIFKREDKSFSFYNPNEGYFYFTFEKDPNVNNQLIVELTGLPFVNTIEASPAITTITPVPKTTLNEQDVKDGQNGKVVEVVRTITNLDEEIIYNKLIIFEFYPPEVTIELVNPTE